MEEQFNDASQNGTDTTQTESSTAQTDQIQDTTLDNGQQNQTTNTETTEQNQETEVEDESKEDPLHKNPRFKEVIEEKNLYKEQLKLLQAQIEEQKAKSSLETKEDAPVEDIPDEQFDKYLSKLPERTFKESKFDEEGNLIEGYQTIGEMYADFRKQILKDISLVDGLAGQEIQQTKAQQDEADKQEAAKVKSVLEGSQENIDMFTQWAESLYKKPTAETELLADLSLAKQAMYFKQHVLNGLKTKAANTNRDAARRANTGNPAIGTQPNGLPVDQLRKKSISDFYGT